MRKLILFFSLLSVLSCHKAPDGSVTPAEPKPGPVVESEGILSDKSPVDGCSLLLYSVRDSTDFAISDPSLPLIKPYLVYNRGIVDTTVIVRYQTTGNKKDASCGWAGPKPFDEVTIVSIKPR